LRAGEIRFRLDEGLALIERALGKTWVVEIRPPLAGPQQVLRYLSRYVQRIAIANSRILSYDGQAVVFRYKDRADGGRTKTKRVSGVTFCRLFLQHVLPPRFVRIRHYGLLAARAAARLALCRELLAAPPLAPREKESWARAYQRIFLRDPLLCPRCQRGHLVPRYAFYPRRE
jgi:hypothetical protein